MIKYQGIATLEVLEGADRYNKWITDVVGKKLVSPILEFGAGTGNISQYFADRNKLYLTDSDVGLVRHLQKRFDERGSIKCFTLDITKKQAKFKDFFSSIYGVNVLEHIQYDEKALKNIHAMLRKNGRLVLLVPAKKFAYTRLDKLLGHYRRYEKGELRRKLENNGFVVEDIFFFNIVGLLTWVTRDKIERKNIHLKPYQIAIFDIIVPFVKILESFIKPPVGISLVVYARKK